MTPLVAKVDRLIKFQRSAVNYFADTHSRFYLHPRSEDVKKEIELAIADNRETDRDLLEHFEKGNLINYV